MIYAPTPRAFATPLLILAGLPFLSSCSNSGTVPAVQAPVPVASQWVVAWGNSPENALTTAENDWIRTQGAALPGVVAIADFDKVLADPSHPDFMLANINSGDNFHPNGVGYGIQSSAIPLSSLFGK